MKKLILAAICCLCLCGCEKNEENLKRTECINQSEGSVTIFSLFHNNNKITKIKYEYKRDYNTSYELKEAEQSAKEYYDSMKQNYEKQGGSVTINIKTSNLSLIQQISYDCKENGFFTNIGCNYQKEIKGFENDFFSHTCIERE